MKIEHIAISSHNERESDDFFIELLGLKKTRSFTVPNELVKQFFGVDKKQKVIRYSNSEVNFEVFIDNEKRQNQVLFAHTCLEIKDRDKFVEKARNKQYEIINVPREGSSNYYLFIIDKYGNLYEIKSQ